MRTSPESGRTSPLRILTRVDLPAPFSPTIARTSPVAMASETSSSATVASKRLERCSMTIAAADPELGGPTLGPIRARPTSTPLLPRPNRQRPRPISIVGLTQ